MTFGSKEHLSALRELAASWPFPFELLAQERTTFHYIGEDTRRALMFDPRRLEAARKEREEKRSLPLDGAGIVVRARRKR